MIASGTASMEIVGIQPKLDAMTCLEDPTKRKSDLLENGYLGDTLKKVLVGELGACEWVGTESLCGEEAEYRVVASARFSCYMLRDVSKVPYDLRRQLQQIWE